MRHDISTLVRPAAELPCPSPPHKHICFAATFVAQHGQSIVSLIRLIQNQLVASVPVVSCITWFLCNKALSNCPILSVIKKTSTIGRAGVFKTEEEAARAYDAACRKHRGARVSTAPMLMKTTSRQALLARHMRSVCDIVSAAAVPPSRHNLS